MYARGVGETAQADKKKMPVGDTDKFSNTMIKTKVIIPPESEKIKMITCKRCGAAIWESDSCGIYGCTGCAYQGLTYNIQERRNYIAARCRIYDSRKDMYGEYDYIWASEKNEPETERKVAGE